MANQGPYNPTECYNQLTAANMVPVCDSLGNPHHCEDGVQQSSYYHTVCGAKDIYTPVPSLACVNRAEGKILYWPPNVVAKECMKLMATDANWNVEQCYCCCSCFANDTLIGVPDGAVEIYTIPVGGVVLAAAVDHDDEALSVRWSEQEVGFSAGTGNNGKQAAMVYLVYGINGAERELVCTMDQPLMLADGKLTTAGKLRPGQQLLDKDCKPVIVRLASVGSYEGGVHHIATKVPWTGSVDNHLILAGGVIAGDFALQAHFGTLPAAAKEPAHDSLPLMGTHDYDNKLADHVQRAEAVLEFAVPVTRLMSTVAGTDTNVGTAVRKLSRGRFVAYRKTAAQHVTPRLMMAVAPGATGATAAAALPTVVDPSVPSGARALLTPAQAQEVINNGSQTSLGLNMQGPRELMKTVIQQLAGFYPDVTVYYDELNLVPNVYAFEAYGKKIVQVNGGFARLQGMVYEGLMMAVGFGMGAFNGGEPQTHGLSAVGLSDWYAFSFLSNSVWVGEGVRVKLIMAAVKQWQALFNLVKNLDAAKGNPQDLLNDPPLACRMDNIWSAIGYGPLLECVGGPPEPKLELQEAKASSAKSVELVFSIELNPDQAQDPKNYTLAPNIEVIKATRNPDRRFRVQLDLGDELESGKSYKLTVSNVTAYSGYQLDPDKDSASIVYKAPKPTSNRKKSAT